MKRTNYLLSALALSFTLAACGNLKTASQNLRGSNSSLQSQYGSDANPYATEAQQCAPNANILGGGYQSYLESEYHACTAPGTTSGMKLFPADDRARAVCVFPARSYAGSVSTFYSSSSPYYFASQCLMLQTAGTTFDFQSLSFNAAFVVDAANASVFAACAMTQDLSGCAAQAGITYSYGQFR